MLEMLVVGSPIVGGLGLPPVDDSMAKGQKTAGYDLKMAKKV